MAADIGLQHCGFVIRNVWAPPEASGEEGCYVADILSLLLLGVLTTLLAPDTASLRFCNSNLLYRTLSYSPLPNFRPTVPRVLKVALEIEKHPLNERNAIKRCHQKPTGSTSIDSGLKPPSSNAAQIDLINHNVSKALIKH